MEELLTEHSGEAVIVIFLGIIITLTAIQGIFSFPRRRRSSTTCLC
jgi:hypothetical protein